ncbi:MAG: TatD family hydrolase [Candidatus Aminicenantaceae bacterium]
MEEKENIFFVDSHAHLGMEDFDQDRQLVVQRAFQKRIKSILCPSDLTCPENVNKTLSLSETFKNLLASSGVHPHQAKQFKDQHIQEIKKLNKNKKIVAVGEIGLDFHYNFSKKKEQMAALRHQLITAQQLHLPVIIHSRKSGSEIIVALKNENFSQGGVLHCFTEDWQTAKMLMDYNFFISFSGILTYPSAYDIRETAKKIPMEKILIETDSPYLVPVSFRKTKKRNEPVYVIEVAKMLSELKNIPLEEIAETTTHNFELLFKFEINNIRC